MFLFAFDPGFDFEPPSGAALFAEIGVDRHTVLEVFEDARAIRCPDRDSVLPDRPVAVLDTRAPFEQAVGADDRIVGLSGGDAASKLDEAAQVVGVEPTLVSPAAHFVMQGPPRRRRVCPPPYPGSTPLPEPAHQRRAASIVTEKAVFQNDLSSRSHNHY